MENQAKPKSMKYFEVRIDGFKETLERLRLVQERLESIELTLTGTRARDKVDEKIDTDALGEVMSTKPNIMQELNTVNTNFNTVITNMQDSLSHLEEIV